MEAVIKSVKKIVPDEKTRMKIYKPVIQCLEDMDWDTEDEVLGMDPAFDKVFKKMYPEFCEASDE